MTPPFFTILSTSKAFWLTTPSSFFKFAYLSACIFFLDLVYLPLAVLGS